MNQSRRIFIGVGFMVAALLVSAMLARHWSSRSALSAYKTELLAKGEKLTLAMLTSGRATNVNTSQAVVTNAVAKFHNLKSQPSALEPRKFVAPGQAQVTWKEATPGWNLGGGSPLRASWDELAADIESARAPLEEIRQALKDPAPDAGPLSTNMFEMRINTVAIRTAAQWLMGATVVALRQGHAEEALENLEALTALARMNREEPTLVAQMIRIAIANLGLAATWEALAAPGWTDPQLKRLQKAWEGIDLVDAVEKGFLAERAFGPEVWRIIRHNDASKVFATFGQSSGSLNWQRRAEDAFRDYVAFPAYRLTSVDDDELFFLKVMQEAITGLRRLEAREPWKEAKQGWENAFARMDRITGSFEGFHYWFSLMSIPHFSKGFSVAAHAETERQMTLAAIALQRYELSHGKAPRNMLDLVPDFMSAPPKDPMSGKALRYRLNPDGSFLLYSTGEDGVDDGGDPTPGAGKGPGLWEGRDAVWPKAAAR